MKATRMNFVEFLQVTFDDQQELETGLIWDTFVNRIYYKLKSQDLEEHFEFFFNSVGSVDWAVKVLVRLVKNEFYLEDLNQLYLKSKSISLRIHLYLFRFTRYSIINGFK